MLCEKCDLLQKNMNSLQEEFQEYKTFTACYQQELEKELEKAVDDLEKVSQEMQKKVDAQQEKIVELEKEVRKQRNQLSLWQSEFDEANQKVQQMKKREVEMEIKNEELENQLRILQEECERQKGQIAVISERLIIHKTENEFRETKKEGEDSPKRSSTGKQAQFKKIQMNSIILNRKEKENFQNYYKQYSMVNIYAKNDLQYKSNLLENIWERKEKLLLNHDLNMSKLSLPTLMKSQTVGLKESFVIRKTEFDIEK